MKKVVFNKRITLLALKPSTGRGEPQIAKVSKNEGAPRLSSCSASERSVIAANDLQFDRYIETARATVWADVSDAGVTTKMTALSSGAEVQFSVIMWRSEFEESEFTHLEFNKIRYKIIESGSAANPLHIRLLVSRG